MVINDNNNEKDIQDILELTAKYQTQQSKIHFYQHHLNGLFGCLCFDNSPILFLLK